MIKYLVMPFIFAILVFLLPTLRAQSMTNHNMIYNDQGNIQSDNQSIAYRYNSMNQMVSNKIGHGYIVQYAYYPTGMQATENVISSRRKIFPAIYHYYAGQSQLFNSLQQNDFAEYLLANGILLRVYQSPQGYQMQVYVHNRHHTVIGIIARKITIAQQYNAYGLKILGGMSNLTKHTKNYGISSNPLGYNNYSFDGVTGLYYLKSRYYTPVYRIFLSRDSYDLANRYWYGNNNSVMTSDPDGHVSVFDALEPYLEVRISKFGEEYTHYDFTNKTKSHEIMAGMYPSLERFPGEHALIVSAHFHNNQYMYLPIKASEVGNLRKALFEMSKTRGLEQMGAYYRIQEKYSRVRIKTRSRLFKKLLLELMRPEQRDVTTLILHGMGLDKQFSEVLYWVNETESENINIPWRKFHNYKDIWFSIGKRPGDLVGKKGPMKAKEFVTIQKDGRMVGHAIYPGTWYSMKYHQSGRGYPISIV